jgi:transposase InsO family protein
MSGRGNCYDNAMVETVFKAIKSELLGQTADTSYCQPSKAIGQYIEGFHYLVDGIRAWDSLDRPTWRRRSTSTKNTTHRLSTKSGEAQGCVD